MSRSCAVSHVLATLIVAVKRLLLVVCEVESIICGRLRCVVSSVAGLMPVMRVLMGVLVVIGPHLTIVVVIAGSLMELRPVVDMHPSLGLMLVSLGVL